jgi:hypothetical protein
VRLVVRVRLEEIESADGELARVVVVTRAHELGEREQCEGLRVRRLLRPVERPDETAVLRVPEHIAQVGEPVARSGEHRIGAVAGTRSPREHVDQARLRDRAALVGSGASARVPSDAVTALGVDRARVPERDDRRAPARLERVGQCEGLVGGEAGAHGAGRFNDAS